MEKYNNYLYELICFEYEEYERCEVAAEMGNLDVLIKLVENGHHINKLTCASAAKGGYINILDWLSDPNARSEGSICERY